MVETAVPPRSDIAPENTWDVHSIFPDDAAWGDALQRSDELLGEVQPFRGRLGESPAVLADWFDLRDRLLLLIGKVYVYASMQHAVDTSDQGAQGRQDQAVGLFSRALAAASFEEPELLALPAGRLQQWAQEEPRLRAYAHYFDRLERGRPHVRSAEVEELLGLVQDPFMTAQSIHAVLTDADLTFRPAVDASGAEIPISQGNYSTLLRSPDEDVRRTAFNSYADAHLAVEHTCASCLATGVKDHVFMARARRYPSALAAALGPSHIPVEVFHALIDTFRANLPTWHRYWDVKRRALGLDQLHVHDEFLPISTDAPQLPYSEALTWIAGGMAPLGQEYVDVLRRGAGEERWVDIYPNQRKTSGAFSTGWPGTHPFILMSYTDDIFSMSTLAHELGHSMHSHYAWQTQPPIYADYSIFVAEVASNFNQALVRRHVLARADAALQLAVIEEAMVNFHRYCFIMPTLARLELEMHERVERGEALIGEFLTSRLAELFREAYGPNVVLDERRVGIRWAEFSNHMYGNFYVWQYATGIAAANALAQGVVEGGPDAAERYLDFLRAGSSMYPLDALAMAGVDMRSREPVDAAFRVLAGMVDRVEELTQSR